MTFSINNDKTVAVAEGTFWLSMDSCPKGVKILAYPVTGSARIDIYSNQTDLLGWCPLPRKPDWLKQRERAIIACNS